MNRVMVVLVALLAACGGGATQDRRPGADPGSRPAGLPDPEWTALGAAPDVAPTAPDEPPGVAFAPATNRVSIVCKPTTACSPVQQAGFKTALDGVMRHLRQTYGQPTYSGPIRVHISPDLGVGAKMVWKPSTHAGRDVYLSDLSFWPEERKVIVHEMFHALHQNDRFLRTYPDVIVEGLAVHAEYRYRYAGKSRQEIARTMLSHLNALGLQGPFRPEDYNLPFAAKPPAERDLLYIAAGHFFMSQKDGDFNRMLQSIFENPAESGPGAKGTTLAQFVDAHGLTVNPKVFSGLDKKTPAIAAPHPLPASGDRLCDMGKRPASRPADPLDAFIHEIMDETKYRAWRNRNCPPDRAPPGSGQQIAPAGSKLD